MKQVVYKDNKLYCTTTVPYSASTIKSMKQAGYKVKEIEDNEDPRSVLKRSKK